MDQNVHEFVTHFEAKGRLSTAHTYRGALEQFEGWLAGRGVAALNVTKDDLVAYQRWLAEEYRSPAGKLLVASTQATRLSGVKSFYKWLERRGRVLSNPARKIRLPKVARHVTTRAYLTLQEATALLQMQAKTLESRKERSRRWAFEYGKLALLCLAVATGRRRRSLLDTKVADLNLERREIRIEWEKGKAGRVLPVAAWAIAILKEYLEKARPVLIRKLGESHWLFAGDIGSQLSESTFSQSLERIRKRTCAENPDLVELQNKKLTPHSLRVSFATLLFNGGCNIRSVNELMDHENLSTTARYTPIPLEELRRACRRAHPRA